MRALKFSILFCFIISTKLFGQTPKEIENNLLRSFKKIDYNYQDNTIANNLFAGKLQYYACSFPSTLTYPFTLLKKEHLNVLSSDDGLFRIYSWDTWTGGTMHFFENVMQYKVKSKTVAILDSTKTEGDNRPNYTKLYTFKTDNHIYYLAVYLTIGSSKDVGQGIQVFTIENDKLNKDVKLIKTHNGLRSQLDYSYDLFSVVHWKFRRSITFDAINQTIKLPLVEDDGRVTNQYVVYKFRGQYFERVKS